MYHSSVEPAVADKLMKRNSTTVIAVAIALVLATLAGAGYLYLHYRLPRVVSGAYALAPVIEPDGSTSYVITGLSWWYSGLGVLVHPLVAAIAMISLHFARKWLTPRRGLVCASCGYDLRGSVSGRCSECGAAYDDEESKVSEGSKGIKGEGIKESKVSG